MVHIVFRNGQIALDQVVELKLIGDVAGAAETKHPGIACIQLSLNIFDRIGEESSSSRGTGKIKN